MDAIIILNMITNFLLYTYFCIIIAVWSRLKFRCKAKIASGLRCHCRYCLKEALVVLTALEPHFGEHHFAKWLSPEPPAIPSPLEPMLEVRPGGAGWGG